MINEYKFASFTVDNRVYTSDIKIIKNKVKYWADREYHKLKIKNIKNLVEAKPKIIIIGTGASGFLEVSKEIKEYIYNNGIRLIIKKTEEACKEYNRLTKEGKDVAAILHATC